MRTTRGAAAVLLGLALAVLPMAGPASAHTGKLKLEVAGDGATGVTVQARYADGHRLDKLVRLTLSATRADGRAVGPLQLEPVGEGQGFYSSGPVLAVGSWQVTVRAPAPHTAKTTVEVRARPAQTAAAPVAPVSALQPAGPADAGPWRWWPVILSVVGALAVLATVLPIVRRRRRNPL
jgi:hypothetical protein